MRLRIAFKYAVDQELIVFSPAVRLKAGPPPTRERVPSLAELRVIWDASEGWLIHHRATVRLIMLLGLRRTSATLLRMQDFDKEGLKVSVRASTSKTGAALVSPVPQALMQELARLKTHHLKNGPLIGWAGGKHLENGELAKINARLKKLFPNDPITLHDFRRALATHCTELGFEQATVDAQLNHNQSATSNVVTAAYYKSIKITQRRDMLEAYADSILRAD